MLKPNLDLINDKCNFKLSQKYNLHQPFWNFLVHQWGNQRSFPTPPPSHSPSPHPTQAEAIYMIKPLPSLPFRKTSWNENNYFLLLIARLFHFFIKKFTLYSPSKHPSSCWIGCCPIHVSSNSQVDSQVDSVEFCVCFFFLTSRASKLFLSFWLLIFMRLI